MVLNILDSKRIVMVKVVSHNNSTNSTLIFRVLFPLKLTLNLTIVAVFQV
ncbi:MAG: hypothetical protein PWR10_1423 [Halanaerobiales bacterium]|nr:hypothetical protein [Halanaerobiales bacterium]